MTSVGKRAVTTALCALLAVSPLVGCASDAKKADDASAKKEEAFKEVEEPEFKGKKVPYSRQGAYTVTFGEGDLLALDQDPYTGESLAAGDGEAGTDSSSGAADEQKQADEKAAADAKALEDAKAELEGAKAARDEAQRAADEAKAAEEAARAEAETAEAEADKAEAETAQAESASAEDAAKAEGQSAAAGDDVAKAAQEKAEAAAKAAEARAQADDTLVERQIGGTTSRHINQSASRPRMARGAGSLRSLPAPLGPSP